MVGLNKRWKPIAGVLSIGLGVLLFRLTILVFGPETPRPKIQEIDKTWAKYAMSLRLDEINRIAVRPYEGSQAAVVIKQRDPKRFTALMGGLREARPVALSGLAFHGDQWVQFGINPGPLVLTLYNSTENRLLILKNVAGQKRFIVEPGPSFQKHVASLEGWEGATSPEKPQ